MLEIFFLKIIKNASNFALETPFRKNLGAELTFRAPITSPVENLQCLSENWNFLFCLFVLTHDAS